MFDIVGREFGVTKHNHYYYGTKTPKGNVLLTKAQVEEGIVQMNKAAKVLNRKPSKESTINLLARNWFQVKNSTQVIAIAPIDDSMRFVEGGTGWAVAMAQANNKDIHVFNLKNNSWYTWNGTSFVRSTVPLLAKNFAGIGSRQDGKMTPESVQAIRDVYSNTFNKPAPAAVPTSVEQQEIISITPEQLEKDIKLLLNKSLKALNEANSVGKNFILGFHGGKTFDKPDRSKQYTGEFRNPNARRIAESMGARYEGQMLFYTEDLDDTEFPFTYEDAITGATGYAIKYGDEAPSIQAYLIPISNADFTDRGMGEVGVSYDDIESNKIRKLGSVDFTRTTQPSTDNNLEGFDFEVTKCIVD
jgi:hypothetical protein